MKIAFATTLSPQGSTNIGRVFPLASELEKLGHECHVLLLNETTAEKHHVVGQEPFTRTAAGKKRLGPVGLVFNQLQIAIKTAATLRRLRPDVVVVIKSLPANTLGVWLGKGQAKVILDVDDFELMSNQLSSFLQRAAIHWAERTGAKIAQAITAATPFLSDHFKQLTRNQKPVHVIPTGLNKAGEVNPGTQNNVIAYIGSVSVKSGHRVDMLPEILQQVREVVPDCKLVVAGDGDDVEILKKKFSELNLTDAVEWAGRFNAQKISELLAKTSLLVDPVDSSIANRAKSSYRVALATLYGMPVVTSNVGIRPMLLPENLWSKFFAEPGNATGYAQKIVSLLQSKLSNEEKASMQQHADQFTWGALASAYDAIIKK